MNGRVDWKTTGLVMQTMIQARKAREVLELFEEIRERGSKNWGEMIGNIAMKACVMCEEYDRAVELHRELQEKFSGSVRSWTMLLDAYASQGDVPNLEKTLADMNAAEITPNTVTLWTVMKGYMKSGACLRAIQVAEEMSAEYDIEWNVGIYVMIMHAHVRRGDVESAEKTFKDMQKANCRSPKAQAYNVLIDGYAKVNPHCLHSEPTLSLQLDAFRLCLPNNPF